MIMKKASTIDRRIVRTQKLLIDTLLQLSIERGYDAVTIQDITDRANVGRATFYSHYESKDQLLLSGHHELNDILFKEGQQELDFLALYNHAKDSYKIARVLIGYKDGALVLDYIRQVMFDKFKKTKGRGIKASKMHYYTCEAAASAIVRLLHCWLKDDMPFSPAEMAEKSEEILGAFFER